MKNEMTTWKVEKMRIKNVDIEFASRKLRFTMGLKKCYSPVDRYILLNFTRSNNLFRNRRGLLWRRKAFSNAERPGPQDFTGETREFTPEIEYVTTRDR